MALSARRAHALKDPSSIEAGGAYGEHDAHVTCGPGVRVRNASAGVRYEHIVQSAHHSPGVGIVLDARGGVGSTTLTTVYPDKEGGSPSPLQNDVGHSVAMASGQMAIGWDARIFAIRAGGGFYGVTDTHDNRISPHYYFLPAVEMRFGERTGVSADLGLGAPPIVPITRFYSLYGTVQYRAEGGAEMGLGALATIGELDARQGVLIKLGYPIARGLSVGAFGMLEQTSEHRGNLGYTTGIGVRWELDGH